MEISRVLGSIAPPGRVRCCGKFPVVPARGLASPPANFRCASGAFSRMIAVVYPSGLVLRCGATHCATPQNSNDVRFFYRR